MAAGVVDPVKVTRTALVNAASIGSLHPLDADPGGGGAARRRTERTDRAVDCIRLRGLVLFPRLGVAHWEKEGVQKVSVDVEMWADLSTAAQSDRIEDAVDYEVACRVVQDVAEARKYHLVESLAHEILAALMERFPHVDRATIRLRKVSLPFIANLECVEVELERTAVNRAWIAFGANLGDRAATLARAESLLAARGVRTRQCSRLYASRPEGGADEPEYGNAVLETETALDARSFLGALQSVEEELGRPPAHAAGPRTCDLDLLAFDDLVVDEAPGLVLPHPRLHRRAFVLVPLVELDPAMASPGARGRRRRRCWPPFPSLPGRCGPFGEEAGRRAPRGTDAGREAGAWRGTSTSRSKG